MSDLEIKLKLPSGTIIIGPGTVPTSTASVSHTSIKGVIRGMRKISRLKIFDFEDPQQGNEKSSTK